MVTLQVGGGVVRGVSERGIAKFLGVPYAAPPFGPNRMRPPAPVVPWEGIREATQYGPTAPKGEYPPQFKAIFPEPAIAGDECLNLNVWTPEDAVGRGSLPVLVWVHGGSFTNGSGAVGVYEGSKFARDGVVCVTINYRLGAEGFLLTADDNAEGTVNLGLQDQIAALRWVRDNIQAFGGDPARVTVAGQSAGAMAVTSLLAMPAAAGLFAGAILQSGAGANALTPETGQVVCQALASALDTAPNRTALAALASDVISKAVSDLIVEIQTTRDVERWGPLALSVLPLAPVVDGDSLPSPPLTALKDGAAKDVAVLVGSTSQEARLFLVAPGIIDDIDEAFLAVGAASYGLDADGVDTYRRRFPHASPGDLMAQIVTDWYYTVPAVRVAEARELAGAKTWVYQFDWPRPEDNGGLGAAHAVELPFVFDNLDDPGVTALVGRSPSQTVADSTHAAWVRFVTEGTPGWAPYGTALRATAVLAEAITVVEDPDAELRRAWDGIR